MYTDDSPENPTKIVRLQAITLAWMCIECSIALVSAWRAHSSVLLAFGFDSLVEIVSAVVVLLQFGRAFRMGSQQAARWAGMLLFVLAAAVTINSITALSLRVRPETSWTGVAVTIAALIVMPSLAWAKRRHAERTGNRALAADAVQSATCAYLAAITVCGLAINAIFHIRWIDPIAALAAVPLLWLEGKRSLRGDHCC